MNKLKQVSPQVVIAMTVIVSNALSVNANKVDWLPGTHTEVVAGAIVTLILAGLGWQQTDKAQDEAIGKALADLKAFVAGVHAQEKGGKQFKPEEADTLGKEAQDRADAIVGQVTQVAAKLGVQIEQ